LATLTLLRVSSALSTAGPYGGSVTVATTASKITHQVSGWLARTAVGRLAGRSIASLVRVEVFDRAMTLAAQAFTSILPIVVAIAAFSPSNADQLGGTLAEQLG
jgi:membrane protein